MNNSISFLLYDLVSKYRKEDFIPKYRDLSPSGFQSIEEYEKYKNKKLESLTSWASLSVSFYKKLNLGDIGSFPVLTKDMLEAKGEEFCCESSLPVTIKSSSGTTSQPVKIKKDSYAMGWEQAVTYRSYRWAEISPGDKQARFWSTSIGAKNKFKQKLKEFALNRITYSAYSFDDSIYQGFAERLEVHKPNYFYGFPSFIADFASYLESRDWKVELKSLKAIITTAEALTQAQREVIERVFKVKVFQEYGCGEVGTIAHQNKDGAYFTNAENLYLEVLKEDGSISEFGKGELLVTEYFNRVQPIIRYRLGDVVTLSPPDEKLNIILPRIDEIHGRVREMFEVNGKKYSPAFFEHMLRTLQTNKHYLKKFQVIIKGQNLEFKIVKGVNFSKDIEGQITNYINANLGTFFKVEFSYHEDIAREPSGKYNLVKNLTKV